MYLWSVNRLVEDFRGERVTERQQLSYLLFSVVLYTLLMDAYLNSFLLPELVSFFDKLMLPVSLTVAVAGTVLCFRVSPPDGKGFLNRYYCIAVPVGVRVFVIALAGLIAWVLVSGVLELPWLDEFAEAEGMTGEEFVGLVGLEVAYYWYLRRAIQRSYVVFGSDTD